MLGLARTTPQPESWSPGESGLQNLARVLAPTPGEQVLETAESDATSVPEPVHSQAHAFPSVLERVLRGQIPFGFHFQPVVDLRRGVVVGYEALVRFGGEVPWSPDRWFAEAERYGQRLALEALVTRQVLQAPAHLPRNCFLSINVSPSFVLSEQWDQALAGITSFAGVVIEITENEPVSEYGPLLHKIAQIRERGGSVAVDDAGSGYASLNHVMQLKPDFVKLDRSFVYGCDADRAKSALIEMVGKAAGRLDAWIIAEGVETSAELDELIRLDVPLAQGYYLSRPAPDMRALTQEKSTAIVERVQARASTDSVAISTEFCTVCASQSDAAGLLAERSYINLVMVTDPWGRPQHVVERHPLLGIRTVSTLMKVQVTSEAREVLQRSMTRSEASRFDPLVAVNEQGEFVGIIRIDRLVGRLLATV